MFEKQKSFGRKHILLTSFHHFAAGLGLAIVLQHYLVGNAFISIVIGWLLLGFSTAVHIYEFSVQK